MQSEISVVAVVRAKEGQRDVVRKALIEILAPTRAEAGCRLYVLHEDIKDADTFIFYEKWESAEALEMHMKSAHFAQLAEALQGKADVVIHEAKQLAD